uniref:Uncharacterized protein n=1 Tax=Xiphophorus couchianus TaxID=32473 RepID=A0A3B5LV99_9TELE
CPTLFVEVEPIGDDRDRASQDITSDQQRLIFSCKHFQKESINPCLKGNRQIFVKTTTMDEEQIGMEMESAVSVPNVQTD